MCARLFVDMGNFSPKFSRLLDSKGLMLTRGGKSGHAVSTFPVYCDWETFGLPGMKVRWEYALEKAGQLGHVAYRHRKLECTFDGWADQQRFAEIWRRHIGKTPVFEPAEGMLDHGQRTSPLLGTQQSGE
jgi:hypothetical protein